MSSPYPVKILMAKAGMDGHDRGAKVISAILRDSGMEVVYLGPFQTAERVVRVAIEEDVDVIGLSSLSGEHLSFSSKVIKLLKESSLDHVMVVMGGVIPVEDIPVLKEMGVAEVFIAGSLTQSISDFITNNVKGRG